MGSKKDKSEGVADGRHVKRVNNHSEEKTAWVSGACFEKGWSRPVVPKLGGAPPQGGVSGIQRGREVVC